MKNLHGGINFLNIEEKKKSKKKLPLGSIDLNLFYEVAVPKKNWNIPRKI